MMGVSCRLHCCKLYLWLCLRKTALEEEWCRVAAGWQVPSAHLTPQDEYPPLSTVDAESENALLITLLPRSRSFLLRLSSVDSTQAPLPSSCSSSEAAARARLITLWKFKVHCGFQFSFQIQPESNQNRLVPLQNTFRICLWRGRNSHILSWVSRNIFSLSCVKDSLTIPICLYLL